MRVKIGRVVVGGAANKFLIRRHGDVVCFLLVVFFSWPWTTDDRCADPCANPDPKRTTHTPPIRGIFLNVSPLKIANAYWW